MLYILLDSTVKIWNTFSVLGEPKDVEDSLICTLTSHSGSVNVVRWSRDGKYLVKLCYYYHTSQKIHHFLKLNFITGFWI
jgi:WD40 repeat protein